MTTRKDSVAAGERLIRRGSTEAKALLRAHRLVDMGVPVFVARLDKAGNPVPPKGWQTTEPHHSQVDKWRPGLALCAVTGVVFDVIDWDPRNDPDGESFRQLSDDLGDNGPEEYWRVRTPSGGLHLWIASLGIRKHIGFLPGLDLQAGDVDGEGRGFVFLPPTVRPAKGGPNDGKPAAYRPVTSLRPPDGQPACEALSAYVARCVAEKPAPTGLGGSGGRAPADELRVACLSAEAGEQRGALLRYVHELERRGYERADIVTLLRALVTEPGWRNFNAKDPWYPARGNPDKWLRGLLHRDGEVMPDATPHEVAELGRIKPIRAGQGADDERVMLAAVPDYPVDALVGPLRTLVDAASNLPPALVAGAGLAALAGVTGSSSLEMPDGTPQRPALWVPLIGPRGGGKTPSLNLAFSTLQELDVAEWERYSAEVAEWSALPKDERGTRPPDPSVLLDDFTVEKLARFLREGDGTACVVADELSGFLDGLGQYKRSSTADRSRFLSLWTCRPWRYQRVDGNIDIYIRHPVVSVVGGLQPALHKLLGDDATGLRPRWLPHMSPTTDVGWAAAPVAPRDWDDTIADLYDKRSSDRAWALKGEALRLWKNASKRWKRRASARDVSDTLAGALDKADVAAARIALVLAESLDPSGRAAGGAGGPVQPEAMAGAVAIMDYVMGCWRALPAPDSFALSRTTAILRPKAAQLLDWLESHGGRARRSDIVKANVAGVMTAEDADVLLREYERVYPGCVRQERTGKRGPKAVVVYAPERG